MRKKRKQKKTNKFLKLKITLLILFILMFLVGGVLVSPYGPVVKKWTVTFSNLCVQKAQFNLEKVDVEGHVRTTSEDVIKRLNLKRGMKIFEVDLEREKESIMTLPWVKMVRIERHLPSQILISLTEKTPIAVWQNKKRYLPIDEEGNPILDDKTVLKNLLLVVGEDAPQHTPELISLLEAYPEIGAVAKSAVRVGKRRCKSRGQGGCQGGGDRRLFGLSYRRRNVNALRIALRLDAGKRQRCGSCHCHCRRWQ